MSSFALLTFQSSPVAGFSGVRSGISSLGGSQSDLSTLALGDLSIDEPVLFPGSDQSSPLPPSVPQMTSDAGEDDTPLTMTVRPSGEEYVESKSDDQAYSSMQMGELVDDGSVVATLRSDIKPKVARELTPLNLSESKAFSFLNQ